MSVSVDDLEDLSLGQPCPFPALIGKSNCSKCDLGPECRSHAKKVMNKEATNKETELELEAEKHRFEGAISRDDMAKLVTLATSEPSGKASKQTIGGVTIVKERLKDGRTWQGSATVELDTTAVNASDLFWNFERRRKWDGTFQEMNIVETHPDGSETVNMAVKTPPFVAPRDFVQVRTRMAWDREGTMDDEVEVDWSSTGNGKQLRVGVVFLPATHEKAPPRDGYVRGTVHFSGIFVEDTGPGKCNFTMVSTTDFGGVPLSDWIVGMLIKMGAKLYFSTFQKALADGQ